MRCDGFPGARECSSRPFFHQGRCAPPPTPNSLELTWGADLQIGLFHFHTSNMTPMPRSRKFNLEKVQASLDKICPKRGFTITPDQVKRVDFERVECPKFGADVRSRTEAFFRYQSAVAVRVGALLASSQFALFSRSSTASGTGYSKYLCWAGFCFHREYAPNPSGRMVNSGQLSSGSG